ncbi:SARP family pathway specific regulatory protein [Streptomyces viridochromogenes DSM 40736]|uniref:SARP family pathway specific regulatory protein n=1 Tax=Streptomyces viridochromogenes (strain DSM 40736 / JCM 4977 / BCRC 1201 / Tue 494) TaxID=591159 RepID=D9XDJ0_STRVT|nr:BTAD domain-containing putative transcriptional regulator [Streptomyces viridochromogenes]EFL30369.1 SARP family pathway specific regulatory protein [Streptomyces viridochromogenes DSM 40736]
MQFRMLGPIEVVDHGEQVPLGGTKQRATLGFLLLQTNKVVATSHLMNALWGYDDVPATARKILQNAVYGLRNILSAGRAGGDPGAAALLTQPPGYMMRVDPERVDLQLFHKWVGQGREQLARGAAEPASALLRDALALWRGPALADLVEGGIQWPELATIENTRLDVMEDYFDAQLACGNHHSVLAELERMVQSEPLRERSCGQLMLALYRCGRQADALNVYSRVRAVLVESLGLEPGRGLQQLQQAILVQDPALSLARPGTPDPFTGRAEIRAGSTVPSATTPSAATPPAAPSPAVSPEQAERRPPETRVPPSQGITMPQQRVSEPAAPERRTDSTRRTVSAMSVRARLAPTLADVAPKDVDALLESACHVVTEQVERFGGTVTASIGSMSLAVFGLDGPSDDDARQAVLAALAIRDLLDVPADGDPEAPRLAVQCAVTTGEVLLRHRSHEDTPTVIGSVLDESQAQLSDVPAGQVRVTDSVRRASEHAVRYRLPDPASGSWEALGARDEGHAEEGGAEMYEQDILRGLVRRTRHRGVPHLVTVLGERGTGKTRLLRDFERWVTAQADAPRILTGRIPAAGEDGHRLRLAAQILAAYCDAAPGEDATAALTRTVRKLFPSERACALLVSRLRPLVTTDGIGVDDRFGGPPVTETMSAWAQLFQQAACQEPLVLCIDDLHRAPDVVLDAVEELAETAGSGPLCVVVGAGPELLLRRPGWAGGKSHATTVTLDRPERVTNEQLVRLLLSASGNEDVRTLT